MEPDLALVLGLIFCGIGMMQMISAMSAGRSVAAGVFIFLAGSGFAGFAYANVYGNYTITELPRVLLSVVSRYLM